MQHPYQTAFWNALKEKQGWEGVSVNGCFFLLKNIPFLGKFAVGNFMAVGNNWDSTLSEVMEKYGARLVLVNPVDAVPISQKYASKKLGFELLYHQTYVLDISVSEEDIFKGFSSNFRNEIRKVEKSGQYVLEENNQAYFSDFYSYYKQRMAEEKQPCLTEEFVRGIFDGLGKDAHLFSLRHKEESNPSHYLLTLSNGNTAMYLLGANRKSIALPGAGKQVFLSAFHYFKKKGFRFFEFGGIIEPAPNDRIATINQFKKRFGSTYKEMPGSFVFFGKGIKAKLLFVVYQMYRKGYLNFILNR